MLSFILACILIESTPGPNMTWLAVLGSTRGKKPALAAVAGIGLGLSIAAAIAGAGLTTVLNNFPDAFNALRWAGTFYLFYLAWDSWRDADDKLQSTEGTNTQSFRQGLISNILNPKAYLFYGAMLPQFIDKSQSATQQVAVLSAIYVAIATSIHAGIALASGSMANWLATSPQAVTLRRILSLMIGAAAVWFFYSTRLPS